MDEEDLPIDEEEKIFQAPRRLQNNHLRPAMKNLNVWRKSSDVKYYHIVCM